jgi:TolB protein
VRIIKLISFSFVLMAVANSCWSILDLNVTQSKLASVPIAILPFQGVQPKGQSIGQIVGADLSHSGDFNVQAVAGNENLLQAAMAHIDFERWRQKNVSYILTGKVKVLGADKYQVSFQLVNALAVTSDGTSKNHASTQTGEVLVSNTLTTTAAGLRTVAHYISDVVYKKITGIRGAFSTKIAYVTVLNQGQVHVPDRYELNIADQDGYNQHVLLESSEPIMSPAWSPDGKRIAYVSFEGGRAAIYVQDIATGRRNVVSNYSGVNGAPAFSPVDPNTMAVVLNRSGNLNIYTLNLQHFGLKKITHNAAINTEPAWSPDGKSIIFTSSKGSNPQVYRYDFNKKIIERLTFNGNYNARASFVPGTDKIVMMHRDRDGFDIATQDLGSAQVAVLTHSGYDESPSVSPNGKMVVFASRSQTGREILSIVPINGKERFNWPLSKQNEAVRDPAWSPYMAVKQG